jgi:hypothetical protein
MAWVALLDAAWVFPKSGLRVEVDMWISAVSGILG